MAAKRDSLTRYREKRDFSKTSEPKGVLETKTKYRYLIQKHAATRLHYDFRLELDGTLKSWAVKRGPSLNPADKRLAVEVEDHPVSYGSFEGTIPKGQYGGGTVMLWDEGSWEPIGDPRKGLAKGKLEFKLHGKRLHGEWTLVRMRSREKDKGRNNWLLIKHRDEFVDESNGDKLLAKYITSVVSGRSMEKIDTDNDKVWKSNHAEVTAKPVVKKAAKKSPLSNKIPAFKPPQLATLSTTVPKGSNWVHEIKFDGYRMLSYIENGKVAMYSRNGKDWTDAFRPLADKLAKFSVKNAIVDGEVIVTDENGRSDFSQLKDALSKGELSRFQYYAFDLLYLNDKDCTKLPLLERKQALKALIQKNVPTSKSVRIFYSEHFDSDGDEFLRKACSLHLEGVVSKRIDAAYQSGRGKAWLKTKCQKRQEFVIGGYTYPSDGSKGIGALLLGYYDGQELMYAGKVGTGFTADSLAELRGKLDKLVQKDDPFFDVTALGRRGAKWVKPQLIGEVEFGEWTPDGHLRHSSFKGLREDKKAKDIVKEVAVSPKVAENAVEQEVKMKPVSRLSDKSSAEVAGIKVSHPDRIIYPDANITKLQLAEYYNAVASYILPHVVDRPLSILRCPEGTGEACFFQRHLSMAKSPFLHQLDVTVKNETRDYLMIHDIEGLISLIQWGVIELHPWQCKANNLAKPDRIIFDLDPDPAVSMKQLIEGALEVKDRLAELGLESFLKTTGGKGFHIVAPLTPKYNFDTIKQLTKAIAHSMAKDNPKRYIATMSKAARKGRIFIDYLRNDVTSTAVAAFSARARIGASVSMPLAWPALTPSLKLSLFTIENVPDLLRKQKKDPWDAFLKTKQHIAQKYLKALQIDPA